MRNEIQQKIQDLIESIQLDLSKKRILHTDREAVSALTETLKQFAGDLSDWDLWPRRYNPAMDKLLKAQSDFQFNVGISREPGYEELVPENLLKINRGLDDIADTIKDYEEQPIEMEDDDDIADTRKNHEKQLNELKKKLIEHNNETLHLLTGFLGAIFGSIVGMIVGFFVGNIPGLILGAVVGAASGMIAGRAGSSIYTMRDKTVEDTTSKENDSQTLTTDDHQRRTSSRLKNSRVPRSRAGRSLHFFQPPVKPTDKNTSQQSPSPPTSP